MIPHKARQTVPRTFPRKDVLFGVLVGAFSLWGLGIDYRQTRQYHMQSNSEPSIGNDNEGDAGLDEELWWRCCVPAGTMNLTVSHPHQGARHPNGTLGMVVDPSMERLLKPRDRDTLAQSYASPVICPPENATFGIEGEGGNEVLHKIRRGLQKARKELHTNTSLKNRQARILCMVYTVHTADEEALNQAAAAETWGRDCDGFIGASNFTNHSIGTIDLTHAGSEEYMNMWQKVRSMWTYADDHYLDEFDFFYICGDDTFVLVDHLRYFLAGEHVSRLENGFLDRISRYHQSSLVSQVAAMRPRPLVFAQPFSRKYNAKIAGGGGYVLNRAAVRMWGQRGADYFLTDHHDSKEDFIMSRFFIEQGVFISDTQDDEGGWRFLISGQASSDFDGANSPISPGVLQRRYGFQNRIGVESASQYQISFHLKRLQEAAAENGLDSS